MKLELLTNAIVVDDAIKFVAFHAAPVENTNSNKMIDMAEKNHSHDKQESIATTNTVCSIVTMGRQRWCFIEHRGK